MVLYARMGSQIFKCSHPSFILPWNPAYQHSQLRELLDQCFQCRAKPRFLNPFRQRFNPRPLEVTSRPPRPCFPPDTTCSRECRQPRQDHPRHQSPPTSRQTRIPILTPGCNCHRLKMGAGWGRRKTRDHLNVSF